MVVGNYNNKSNSSKNKGFNVCAVSFLVSAVFLLASGFCCVFCWLLAAVSAHQPPSGGL
jgi:hypothetical protein